MALDADTIDDRLATVAEAGRRPLVAGPSSVSFADAAAHAAAYRTAFASIGVAAGHRVAVAISDDALVAPVLLALWQAGASAVLLPVTAPRAEAARVLEAAGPIAAAVDRELADAWALHERHLPVLPIAERTKRSLFSRLMPAAASASAAATYPAALDRLAPATTPAHVPADAEALVLSTSGSTGQPSLVPLTRLNLAAQADTMSRRFAVAAGDAVLNVSPMNHVDGVTGLFMALFCRATLVRVPFRIQALHEYTDAIWRYDVTHALVVPTILSLLLRLSEDVREAFAAERFRLVVSTAAPLGAEVWRGFEAATGRPVVNMYGLTECGNVLFAGPDDASRVIGTVGEPVDCEIALLDPDDVPVADGDEGVVWVAGPSVAPNAPGVVQREGRAWFPTGDLARRGEDGLYRIVGRQKNVIITGGRNIYPQEVDAAWLAHPDVLEAVTIGRPDPVWGEQAVSVVATRSADLDEEALLRHAAEHLTDWKIPRRVLLAKTLPKGATGKVDRAAVREHVERELLPAEGAGVGGRAAIEARVLELAAQAFRVPRAAVTPASRAGELRGWDSLAHLAFVVALEQAFDVALEPADVVAMDTVARAIDEVTRKVEARRP